MRYDTRSDVLSVVLRDALAVRTVEFQDSHLVDLAANGTVVAIEVLTPDDPRLEEVAAHFGLQAELPDILAAVEAARKTAVTGAGYDVRVVQGTPSVVTGIEIIGISEGSLPSREIDLVGGN